MTTMEGDKAGAIFPDIGAQIRFAERVSILASELLSISSWARCGWLAERPGEPLRFQYLR
jgi:hypothetical protein